MLVQIIIDFIKIPLPYLALAIADLALVVSLIGILLQYKSCNKMIQFTREKNEKNRNQQREENEKMIKFTREENENSWKQQVAMFDSRNLENRKLLSNKGYKINSNTDTATYTKNI
jgi:hypothetical protein